MNDYFYLTMFTMGQLGAVTFTCGGGGGLLFWCCVGHLFLFVSFLQNNKHS